MEGRGTLARQTFAGGRSALRLEGLRAVPLAKLRRLIQPSGFFTRKAPALKAFVAMVDEEFGGSLKKLAATPISKRFALSAAGFATVWGQETADAILLYALGHAVPVADEYRWRRIVERHRLTAIEPSRKQIAYDSLTDLTRRAFNADPTQNHASLFNEVFTVALTGRRPGKGNATHCGRTV